MKYSESDKKDICKSTYVLIVGHGSTLVSCAERFDISRTSLRRWLKQYLTKEEQAKLDIALLNHTSQIREHSILIDSDQSESEYSDNSNKSISDALSILNRRNWC